MPNVIFFRFMVLILLFIIKKGLSTHNYREFRPWPYIYTFVDQ